MFLSCERCKAKFLPATGFWFTNCPRCRAKQETSRAADERDDGAPLRLLGKNHAPWMPRWVGAFAGSIVFIFCFGNAHLFGRFDNYVMGVQLALLALGALWWLTGRTLAIEAGAGRLKFESRLGPWPGTWIPASAVEKLVVHKAEDAGARIDAQLAGTETCVTLMESLPLEQVDGVAQRLEAKLREPAPPVLPEISIRTGEREAHLSWNCERAVRVDITAHTIAVRTGLRADLELDTDAIESVGVWRQPELKKGLVRYKLVVALHKREPVTLIEDELVNSALELCAKEIRRVLRLEPAALPPVA